MFTSSYSLIFESKFNDGHPILKAGKQAGALRNKRLKIKMPAEQGFCRH
jgi:hypothetical protein